MTDVMPQPCCVSVGTVGWQRHHFVRKLSAQLCSSGQGHSIFSHKERLAKGMCSDNPGTQTTLRS